MSSMSIETRKHFPMLQSVSSEGFFAMNTPGPGRCLLLMMLSQVWTARGMLDLLRFSALSANVLRDMSGMRWHKRKNRGFHTLSTRSFSCILFQR